MFLLFNNAPKSLIRNNLIELKRGKIMGFLNFLKKQKPKGNVEFEDLDLPPAPPPMEEFDPNLDIDEGNIPEIPTPEDTGMDEPFKPETPEMEAPDFSEIPAEPGTEEHEEYVPIEDVPPPKEAQTPVSAPSAPAAYEKRYRGHFPKTMYININDLKDVLINAKMIKNDLNMAQSAHESFEDIRMKQQKTYDKLSSISHDLQKKLIYMDKNLFNKGEKA